MKIKIILLLFVLSQTFILPQGDNKNPSLIMQDGQLKSHPVRVFIRDAEITRNMRPILCLVAIDQVTRKKYNDISCKGPSFRPFEVASGQTMAYKVEGISLTINGTMMLFDIDSLIIPYYQTGMRVVPVIYWISDTISLPDGGIKNEYSKVIGEDEIYIGNGTGAFLWTALIVALFIVIVKLMTFWGDKKFFDLIKIYDTGNGRLSLSLTQMLLWTIAIGIMVMIFSLMYLQVPHIPESLVALMGLSVVTGSIGHYQTNKIYKQRKNDKAEDTGNTKKDFPKALYGLIAIEKSDGEVYPSIAKTQNLFWTIITLILFIWKSSVDGQLWEVPGELVVLMGVSQTSYLIRNQMEIKPESVNTTKPK